MRCIAIDDEPLALHVIEDYCSKIDFLHLEGTFTSAIDAVKILNKHKIDLVFIDIQMPNITGIEFVRMLKKPPLIIFTTAFSEYAIESFELNALDYLLKPIPFDRFFHSVNKAYELYCLKNNRVTNSPLTPVMPIKEAEQKFILIKVEYSTVKVAFEDIQYIEGIKDYVKIKLTSNTLITKVTMKYLEEKLPKNNFMRVHKSFIVSLNSIEKIENSRIIIENKFIPIGSSYRLLFNEYVNQYKL